MKTSPIIKAIDAHAAGLRQEAQADYDRTMKMARRKMETVRNRMKAAERAFKARQEGADAIQRAALLEAQKWREKAIAEAERVTNAGSGKFSRDRTSQEPDRPSL